MALYLKKEEKKEEDIDFIINELSKVNVKILILIIKLKLNIITLK